MIRKLMLLLVLGGFIQGQGQEPLSVFENLMEKTWFAEGDWGNGTQSLSKRSYLNTT